ncbi:hypothetical protein R2R70_05980 [Cobetia sp. SIMBA_158]|uniref:hypothetical protein n=1 Tax=Cobetia sp. SIMBA_158 TaxID=3081617 RepID=UPI00397F9196
MISTETGRQYSIYGTCLLPRITGQEKLTDTVLAWDLRHLQQVIVDREVSDHPANREQLLKSDKNILGAERLIGARPKIIGLLFRDGQYRTFRRPSQDEMQQLAKLLQFEPPLDVPILDERGYCFEECVQIVAARSPTLPIPAIAVTVMLCFAPTVLSNVGLVDTASPDFSELDWWLFFVVLPLTSLPFMYLRAKASLARWQRRLSEEEADYLNRLVADGEQQEF